MTPAAMPAGWAEAFDSQDGVELHYVRTAITNRPTFVLLHGFGDNGLAWSQVARALADDFDVVMLDCRGHGQTTTDSPNYTLVDMVSDVAGLIEHLGIGPTVVMGHSMGGLVATEFAARHPQLVERLVLVDPPYRWVTRLGGTGVLVAGLWLMKLSGRRLSPDRIRQRLRSKRPTWTDEDVDTRATAIVESSSHSVRVAAKAYERHHDFLPALRAVRAPTLLVTAENGVLKSAEIHEVVTALRDGTEAHIPRAGHDVPRDNFSDFVTAVATFASGDQPTDSAV